MGTPSSHTLIIYFNVEKCGLSESFLRLTSAAFSAENESGSDAVSEPSNLRIQRPKYRVLKGRGMTPAD